MRTITLFYSAIVLFFATPSWAIPAAAVDYKAPTSLTKITGEEIILVRLRGNRVRIGNRVRGGNSKYRHTKSTQIRKSASSRLKANNVSGSNSNNRRYTRRIRGNGR